MACSRTLPLPCLSGVMEVLRAQSVKLEISVADLLVQFVGHLASESEAMARPPEAGDDPTTRFILRDSLRESYRLESVRSGLPIRTLLYRCVQRAADVFDGRQYEAAPGAYRVGPAQGGSKMRGVVPLRRRRRPLEFESGVVFSKRFGATKRETARMAHFGVLAIS